MPQAQPQTVPNGAAPLPRGIAPVFPTSKTIDPEPAVETVWPRSLTLALAQQSCSHCFGLGLCAGRGATMRPCNCVFRAVFRACYARFRQCASKEKYISRVSLEANPGRRRVGMWSLKNEEFIADFCLLARRALSGEQHKLFTFHFLLGADWKLCARKLGCDRGEFFHEVYRVEQKLGRAFGETVPYALFPCDEYFSTGCARRGTPERKEARREFESLFRRALAAHD